MIRKYDEEINEETNSKDCVLNKFLNHYLILLVF
jgi:hypothetical protein